MNEKKSISFKNVKSDNYFSSSAVEFQYVPYRNQNGDFVSLTFFQHDMEADLETNEPKIHLARKALCTITLTDELIKELAQKVGAQLFEKSE